MPRTVPAAPCPGDVADPGERGRRDRGAVERPRRRRAAARARATSRSPAPRAPTPGSCAPTSSRSTTRSCSSSAPRCWRWAGYNDAVISVGLGLVNAAISAVQEIRAKRQLDRLQLLAAASVVVVRDGRDTDVVAGGRWSAATSSACAPATRSSSTARCSTAARRGRRVAAHRRVRAAASKQPGDDLLSGSLCVGGEGLQLARDVGAASYANRLTAEARRDSTDVTPLQRRIAFVIRLIMVLVALMGGDDPAAGRARGLHPAARRADVRGAVRAGALRPVLPDRARLHRRAR